METLRGDVSGESQQQRRGGSAGSRGWHQILHTSGAGWRTWDGEHGQLGISIEDFSWNFIRYVRCYKML